MQTHFAGPEMTPAQISAKSEIAKPRDCVSCGQRIPKGHICGCQTQGAINCPVCKRNIKDPENNSELVKTGSAYELRINCPRLTCKGYLYTYVYREDFVAPPPGV